MSTAAEVWQNTPGALHEHRHHSSSGGVCQQVCVTRKLVTDATQNRADKCAPPQHAFKHLGGHSATLLTLEDSLTVPLETTYHVN